MTYELIVDAQAVDACDLGHGGDVLVEAYSRGLPAPVIAQPDEHGFVTLTGECDEDDFADIVSRWFLEPNSGLMDAMTWIG